MESQIQYTLTYTEKNKYHGTKLILSSSGFMFKAEY